MHAVRANVRVAQVGMRCTCVQRRTIKIGCVYLVGFSVNFDVMFLWFFEFMSMYILLVNIMHFIQQFHLISSAGDLRIWLGLGCEIGGRTGSGHKMLPPDPRGFRENANKDLKHANGIDGWGPELCTGPILLIRLDPPISTKVLTPLDQFLYLKGLSDIRVFYCNSHQVL
jgi:hypothetical protein